MLIEKNFLTELLQRMPDLSLSIWGDLWQQKLSHKSKLLSYIRGDGLAAQQLVCAFRCAKIVLNFLRQQNKGAHNMRTFEVPACGGFLLTQRSYEQATIFFTEGNSIACFEGIDELVYKIRYFLEHDEERIAISEAGYQMVKKNILSKYLTQLIDHRVL